MSGGPNILAGLWWTRAVVPALGIFALAAPIACADSDETPNPGEPNEAGSPALDGGAPDVGKSVEDAPSLDTCSPAGFCPTPLAGFFPLFATTASSESDVWAAGRGGFVHWDGASWSLVHPTAIERGTHVGLWTTKTDDVWLASTRKIVRYSKADGATPKFREFASDLDVVSSWVDPATNLLWEVASENGSPPTVYRIRDDGGASLVTENLNLQVGPPEGPTYRWTSIWGFGASDVYVGGEMCPYDFCGGEPEALRGAIAHYDGARWSIALLGAAETVNAMIGTKDAVQPKHLWLWLGTLSTYASSMTSLRLVPIANDGSVGSPVVAKDLPVPPTDPWRREACTQVVGSVPSSSAAWLSNGCLVYRWDGTKLEAIPTAVNGVPLGRVHGLWASAAGDAWLVGEATQLGVGFAARRTSGGNP